MENVVTLKDRLKRAEVVFTEDIGQAIYILPDGSLIDGGFDCGIRGIDHRIISAGIPKLRPHEDATAFWEAVHKEYNLVRLVPESKTALIRPYQQLTEIQANILAKTDYEIEYY